ncbi:MAG: anti-sigma F factor [Clostridiales bacterium]|nr:anti-sigma F factor [Clostridiales bacterium]
MSVDNKVFLSFKSLPRNVALARLVVASMLAEDEILLSELDEIKVAVSEAVSNAIIHGYLNDGEKTVEMEVTLSGGLLSVRVSDTGVGIEDVGLAMKPNYSQIEERLGLGFCFMQSFMDEVLVQSAVGKGTTVTLRKKLGGRVESLFNASE